MRRTTTSLAAIVKEAGLTKKTALIALAVLVLGGSAFGQLQAPGEDNTPAVGAMAPDYGLDGLRGETKVLLAFFPAAFTPG
jgi:hypothetical protein